MKDDGGTKKVRIQCHLGVETVERLGVHCALVRRSESAVVEEILAGYLKAEGRGRELWENVGAAVPGS
jgi:hypothetical protein